MKFVVGRRIHWLKALWSGCVFGAVTVLLSGCGGGGGGSNSTVAPQGDLAFRAASIATDQALNSGLNYPLALLQTTGLTGSPGIARVAAALKSHATNPVGTPSASATQAGRTRAGTFTLDTALNLYSFPAVVVGNTSVTTYYADAAGLQPAGSITFTKQGVSNFAANYTKYPATATGVFNLTAGNAPCQGKVTIVYSDATGANTMTGHLNLTRTGIGIDLNLTLSDPMNVAGKVVIQENGQTITATNISGPLFSTLSCQVQISPQNWTGTGTFSLADGSFLMSVTPGSGTDTAQTDTAFNLAVAYADGQSEVISAPLLASPLGSIGSNPGSGTYNAPVAVGVISGINASGQMVGVQGFYASPTSAPHVLKALSGGTATPVAINASGQIVGYNSVPGGDPTTATPLYWPTPTSQPVALKSLTPGAITRVYAINALGQMVGMSETSSTNGYYQVTPLYWANASATPVTFPMDPFVYAPNDPLGGQYDPATSFFIADDGTVLILTGQGDLSGDEIFKVPASASGTIQGPTQLATIPGQFSDQGSAMSSSDIIAGISGGATPVIWPNSSAPAQALPVPATYQAALRYLTSINNSGFVVGVLQNSAGQLAPYLWKNGTAVNINTLLPSGTSVPGTGNMLINDAGVIVVTGANTSYVLVPR